MVSFEWDSKCFCLKWKRNLGFWWTCWNVLQTPSFSNECCLYNRNYSRTKILDSPLFSCTWNHIEFKCIAKILNLFCKIESQVLIETKMAAIKQTNFSFFPPLQPIFHIESKTVASAAATMLIWLIWFLPLSVKQPASPLFYEQACSRHHRSPRCPLDSG